MKSGMPAGNAASGTQGTGRHSTRERAPLTSEVLARARQPQPVDLAEALLQRHLVAAALGLDLWG